METLYTAAAIFIQALLLTAGWVCAQRALDAERRLKLLRATVGELEIAQDSLRKQLATLRGKFYATKDQPQWSAGFLDPRPDNHPPTLAPKGHVCENWLTAQNPNDPGWRKARECECDYCLAARRARAQEKRAILEARSSAKPNGSD